MARKRKKRTDGRYEIKVIVGKSPSGQSIRKSFYSAESIADAKQKAQEYRTLLAEGKIKQGEPVRKCTAFSEWADTWLEVYKKPFVSEATYRSTYKAYVYNHMIPYFGNRPLREISQADVQKYFSLKADKSQSFLNKNKFILSAIFETAMENDECERNPVNRIKYASKQQRHVKKALTDAQILQLENLALHSRPEVVFLLNTGLRRGELCGLQWTDIDLEARTLTVNRAIAEHGGRCSVNPPKFKSYRVIPINAKAMDILAAQPKKSIWVFPSRTGGFMRPDNWTDRLESFIKDLPPELQCTSHELRHTYGSYLRRHGVDIYTIQQILGHKDINVTAGIYVHADIATMRREITQADDDFLTTKERQ